MSLDDKVSLDGIRSLTSLLERLPQGTQARAVAEHLGLWSKSAHANLETRQRVFPTAFARLNDDALSDEYAYWLAEVGRSTELCGLLEGQRKLLEMETKSLRLKTRARLRRSYAAALADPASSVVKQPAVTQLNDEVEEDPAVLDVESIVAVLVVVQESAKAYKEAVLSSTAGLSREISFRQAQFGARIRA